MPRLESAAWRYASEGFCNILALTGDYPTLGFGGSAGPVFDLDSIGLIALLRSMNDGLNVVGRRGSIEQLPKTDFFIGFAVSPFNTQRTGADAAILQARPQAGGWSRVIPQLGYDMRKFHEVKLMLASRASRFHWSATSICSAFLSLRMDCVACLRDFHF